jgi:hypothetical protein
LKSPPPQYWRLLGSLITQGQAVTMRLKARRVVLGKVKIICSRALMAKSSK